MRKRDLRKELKHLYAPSATAVGIVDVPGLNFLMIDGAIEPDQSPGTSPQYAADLQALYAVAYTLKFAAKQREDDPVDYPVMPLEGLWWVEDGHFDIRKPGNWKYTCLIMQPEDITPRMFADALERVHKKKGRQPDCSRLRLERFTEGLCVQTMHIGPYSTEPETMARMHAWLEQQGYQDLVESGAGKHHEIYLGDPRRTDPAKLRTVLRHPVRRR